MKSIIVKTNNQDVECVRLSFPIMNCFIY